ncbi:hypothetical protein SARC_09999 [Sphaeroforma arctica JP610]|uniref:DH domain-containing protein n=1 Tax=Sphaeroforma arctica JP610 TaxID=667725 RepID=A0A0L0FNF2_9EUKA|nr:hypothetical protein SARC_09999 [Sphaeroforma arctica JP610]KNC77538.1 hypothetical protein SARC_09999 [Sphaeroforma arctica JP610]|eukprot:XP_014151440.1 hypothetical protein SARC_09999 [Sphaeroforma arctica JP610]
MLETEQTYVDSLYDMEGLLNECLCFVKPNGPFHRVDIELLFGNVAELYVFHLDLLERLNSCIDYPWFAGTFFNDSAEEMMKLYITYCSNSSAALEALTLLSQDNEMSAIIGKLLQAKQKPLGLGPEILKPVQRILKYPLLLRELTKYSEQGEDGYDDAVEAMDKINTVADYINNRKAADEKLQRVVSIKDKLDHFDEDLLSYGLLIMEASVRVSIGGRRPGERKMHVMEKCILLAKQDYSGRMNFKDLLLIDKTEVNRSQHDPSTFELLTKEMKNNKTGRNPAEGKVKTYKVSCRTSAECKALTKAIQKLTESSLLNFLAAKSQPKSAVEENEATKYLDLDAIERRERRLRELRSKKTSVRSGLGMGKKITHLSIQDLGSRKTTSSPLVRSKIAASSPALSRDSPKSIKKSKTLGAGNRPESPDRRLSQQHITGLGPPTSSAPIHKMTSENAIPNWGAPHLAEQNQRTSSPVPASIRNSMPPPLPPARKPNNGQSDDDTSTMSDQSYTTTTTAYNDQDSEFDTDEAESDFEILINEDLSDTKGYARPPSYPPAGPPPSNDCIAVPACREPFTKFSYSDPLNYHSIPQPVPPERHLQPRRDSNSDRSVPPEVPHTKPRRPSAPSLPSESVPKQRARAGSHTPPPIAPKPKVPPTVIAHLHRKPTVKAPAPPEPTTAHPEPTTAHPEPTTAHPPISKPPGSSNGTSQSPSYGNSPTNARLAGGTSSPSPMEGATTSDAGATRRKSQPHSPRALAPKPPKLTLS